jgi:hypothetical protein
LTWEACVDEIDRTILIAAEERGYFTEIEKEHIIKMSELALKEALK